MKVQRLRFRFRVTDEASAQGARDIGNAWVEAAAAAGLPVARSGKRATAQVSLAAPLPQDATSDAELIDVHLEERVEPSEVLCRVSARLPQGIEAVSVKEVGPGEPSLQSALRWAEYEVAVSPDVKLGDLMAAIVKLLGADSFPMERHREKRVKQYDLRPLVFDVVVAGSDAQVHRLRMRLRAEPEQTARVDQTLLALGITEPISVHRTRLFVEETPAVISAFRRSGQRDS
jgi:radical SAM-linked protein